MCLLFAKSGIELLLLTIKGNNQFWRWESWMLLLGLLAFALLQLWYLHKSLILADPTLVCPLAFCFYNVSCILNSLVYYDQFSLLPTNHLLFVLLGTIILLGGVWSVSVKSGDRPGIDIGTFHESEESAEMALIDGEIDERAPLVRASRSLPSRLPSDLMHARSRGRIVTAPPPLREIAEAEEESSRADVPLTAPISTSESSKPPIHRRRRSTMLSPISSRSQLQGQLLLPTGGLSIGLSPISPGFSVVPQRTLRMRMPDVVRQLRMRRTLSDSDVRDDTPVMDTVLPQRQGDIENQQLPQSPDSHNDSENTGHRRANERWKWVKNIVNRK